MQILKQECFIQIYNVKLSLENLFFGAFFANICLEKLTIICTDTMII